MKKLKKWWYARLRKIDLEVLWPACVKQSGCIEQAKAAFAYHAFTDPAWLFLGEQAIYEAIDAL